MHTISIWKRLLQPLSSIGIVLLFGGVALNAQKLGQRTVVPLPKIPLPSVVTAGQDHIVKRLNTKQQAFPIGSHEDEVTALAVAPGTQGTVVVSGDKAGVVTVWNAAFGRLIRTLQAHTKAVTALTLSPDGATIATVGGEGKLCLWSRNTGKKLQEVTLSNGEVSTLFFAQDGRTLFACLGSSLISWRVISLLNGARNLYIEKEQPLGATPFQVAAVSPDGKRLALGAADATLHIWNLLEKHEESTIAVSEFPITALTWTPDSAWVAAGDSDGNMRVWEAVTSKPRPYVCKARAKIRALGFSSNSKVLVSASEKGVLHFWDTNEGVLLSQNPPHLRAITGLVVLP